MMRTKGRFVHVDDVLAILDDQFVWFMDRHGTSKRVDLQAIRDAITAAVWPDGEQSYVAVRLYAGHRTHAAIRDEKITRCGIKFSGVPMSDATPTFDPHSPLACGRCRYAILGYAR